MGYAQLIEAEHSTPAQAELWGVNTTAIVPETVVPEHAA